jgi:hypothetical protein
VVVLRGIWPEDRLRAAFEGACWSYRSTKTDGRSIDTASAAIFEHLAKSKEIEQFLATAPHNRK